MSSASLPLVSGEKIVRALERLGFQRVKQKGSHLKLRKVDPTGKRTVIVPMHHEVARGTLDSILVQAGIAIGDLKL